jgi:hypothetical protein
MTTPRASAKYLALCVCVCVCVCVCLCVCVRVCVCLSASASFVMRAALMPQYMDIQFDFHGEPVGGYITTYLLEKARVIRCTRSRSVCVCVCVCMCACDLDAQFVRVYACM